MNPYLVLAALLPALCGAGAAVQAADAPALPASGPWQFRVLLDGAPIGQHRFSLQQEGDVRVLRSEARFDVKLLGLTLYRYRHQATEHWQDGCLVEMTARTDDDGKVGVVQARQQGDDLQVRSPQGERTHAGCVFSFAYWNPALLEQTRLLNAQTGQAETVRIESLGDAQVEAQGRKLAARRWRISGAEQPIELWYSPQGDWLALESTVSGGRKLSYRRE